MDSRSAFRAAVASPQWFVGSGSDAGAAVAEVMMVAISVREARLKCIVLRIVKIS